MSPIRDDTASWVIVLRMRIESNRESASVMRAMHSLDLPSSSVTLES